MPTYTIVDDKNIVAVVTADTKEIAERCAGKDGVRAIDGAFPQADFFWNGKEPEPRRDIAPSISSGTAVAGEKVLVRGVPADAAVQSFEMDQRRLGNGDVEIDTAGFEGNLSLRIYGDRYRDAFLDLDVVSLETARRKKSEAISNACAAAITAGFRSSALGVEHLYPTKMTDQQNLASSVLASTLPGVAADWTTPFWCADAAGQWEFRKHSAGQIQEVGRQAKAAILEAMSRNESLQRAVKAASSLKQLEAIRWQ